MKIRQYLVRHRSAILMTIVVLQNAGFLTSEIASGLDTIARAILI